MTHNRTSCKNGLSINVYKHRAMQANGSVRMTYIEVNNQL